MDGDSDQTAVYVDAERLVHDASDELTAYYSFTVHNSSAGPQSYTLFSQPPTVQPAAVEGVVSHAILSCSGIAARTGSASFIIPQENYYAICGSIYSDVAVRVQALDKRPVDLGSGRSLQSQRGTTYVLQTASATPSFGLWEGAASDEGNAGAFCVKTGNFAYENAKASTYAIDCQHIPQSIELTDYAEHYFVALGLSTSASPQVGLYASFTPSPRTTYQITPSKIFYIAPTYVEANRPHPEDMDLSRWCKVDFNVSPPQVNIVHDDFNVLTISNTTDASRPKA